MEPTVHFATDYETGDQSVPTACGKTVSTWNDEPDRGTSNEPDVTCHACLRWLVPRLRESLDHQAKRNIELMHDRLAGKIPGLGVHSQERAAMERVIEAARNYRESVRAKRDVGQWTGEMMLANRPEYDRLSALQYKKREHGEAMFTEIDALDAIRAEKDGKTP